MCKASRVSRPFDEHGEGEGDGERSIVPSERATGTNSPLWTGWTTETIHTDTRRILKWEDFTITCSHGGEHHRSHGTPFVIGASASLPDAGPFLCSLAERRRGYPCFDAMAHF